MQRYIGGLILILAGFGLLVANNKFLSADPKVSYTGYGMMTLGFTWLSSQTFTGKGPGDAYRAIFRKKA